MGLGAALRPHRARAEWLRDEIVVYANAALRPVLAAIARRYPAQLRVFCAAPRQLLGWLAHGTQDDVPIAQASVISAAQRLALVALVPSTLKSMVMGRATETIHDPVGAAAAHA